METAMRNVSINDRRTPSISPLIKSEPVGQQEQPIDFSTKVRVRAIEAEDTTLRKVSNDSAIDVSEDCNVENGNSNTDLAGPELVEPEQQPLIGQPRLPPVSMPIPNINTFLPHSSALPGMGMFYPGGPVFPNFLPPGFSGAPMWPNPMAAIMQQQQEATRKLISQAAINNKQSSAGSGMRPQFPKQFLGKQDIMGMGGGGRGYPGMPCFPNPQMAPANMSNIPDPSILAEALKSHEEMYTAYKQQVLSQKASEDAKRGPRRQPAATVTNGNHSSGTGLPQNGSGSSAPAALAIPDGSSSLSQISEDQESLISPPQQSHNPQQPHHSQLSHNPSAESKYITEGDALLEESHMEGSSSSEDDKNSASGSIGDVTAPPPPGPSNGNGLPSTANSAGVSLHSSDESLQTSEGRRSLTPAHSSNGELNDMTGMRPRSMTLPSQIAADSRLLAHSPSPSVLSTGNSSGPGTPNSKYDRGFRKRARTLPDDQKIKKRDDAYWERRRKNNEAAKRSRDSRRAKEDEIAIRAAFLEQENIRLRLELASLKTQTAKLRSELIIFQGPEDQGRGRSAGPSERSS